MEASFLKKLDEEAGLGDLHVRVAWAYYKEGLTQKEISDRYGINRTKVYRLIQEAREKEIVNIDISHPDANLLSLESELAELYGLDDAMVVPYTSDDEIIKTMLGKAGAFYLRNKGQGFSSLGVGIGDTLQAVADNFQPKEEQKERGAKVVSLHGNLAGNIATTPYSIGNKIADKLNADFYTIWAPAVAESEEAAEHFKSEPWVEKVLNMAEQVDKMLCGIGTMKTSPPYYKELDLLSEEELDYLERKGAVADFLGQFIDENGELLESSTRDRMVALPLEKLQGRTGTIGIAGGEEKFEGILATLKGGYFRTLITDELVAKKLIDEKK
jgi:DNA-binding transcriptional regulator LsrR (DeoR family)